MHAVGLGLHFLAMLTQVLAKTKGTRVHPSIPQHQNPPTDALAIQTDLPLIHYRYSQTILIPFFPILSRMATPTREGQSPPRADHTSPSDEAEQQRKRKRQAESPTRQKSLKISKSLLARFQQMLDPETLLMIQEVASGTRAVPITITSLSRLDTVCQSFGLVHPEATGGQSEYFLGPPIPIVGAPSALGSLPSPMNWEVAEEDLEDWLYERLEPLGIDFKSYLADTISPAALLPRFSYIYYLTVNRQKEASCRPMVDVILLMAMSILTGVERDYLANFVHIPQVSSTARQRKYTPNKFRSLKLSFEVDLDYPDPIANAVYRGRMDWCIGVNIGGNTPHQPSLPAPDPVVPPQTQGYRNILTVIEAKVPESLSRASAQVLAYMGCLYRIRERNGRRNDLSTYGVSTDGYNWQFFRVSPITLGADCEINTAPQKPARVQQSPIYNITQKDNLKIVLCNILFIILRSYETLSPTTSPAKPGGQQQGQDWAGVRGEDDGLCLKLARDSATSAKLRRVVEGELQDFAAEDQEGTEDEEEADGRDCEQ